MTTAFRPTRQSPGVHHRNVGDVLVTALNDGAFEASFEWLTNIDPAEPPALHDASFRAIPPHITINAFLLHLGERLVLVDSGCGGAMGPTLGRLGENLAAMGVAPEAIDTVLVTHLHPDHVGGLVDAEGNALLPNAELIVHEAEPPFWSDDALLAQASEQDRGFIQLARATLAAYRGRVRTIASGEVLPGVIAVPAARPYARPHRLVGRIGGGFVADLGRHRAHARSAVRPARCRYGLRRRRRAGDRDTATDHGHGGDGSAAGGGNASGFSRRSGMSPARM